MTTHLVLSTHQISALGKTQGRIRPRQWRGGKKILEQQESPK